jgi:hypothetical protein
MPQTKQDFERAAELMRCYDASEETRRLFVRFFSTDPHPFDVNGNRRFDAERFLRECEKGMREERKIGR